MTSAVPNLTHANKLKTTAFIGPWRTHTLPQTHILTYTYARYTHIDVCTIYIGGLCIDCQARLVGHNNAGLSSDRPSVRPSTRPSVHRLAEAANGLQPTEGVGVGSARDAASAAAGRRSIARPATDGKGILMRCANSLIVISRLLIGPQISTAFPAEMP